MYDIIIIGAGTAGIAAYYEALKYTKNILIINNGPWETTCARVGCMPSKILIEAANQLYQLQHVDRFGVKIDAQIDRSQVMNYVKKLRNHFTQATLKQVDQWPQEHKISGKAHFINANTVQVNQQTYQGKSFILAVGSRPIIPQQWQQQLNERILTSDQIFELTQLPRSVAVIGSGVIAIELAQALHRLGVATHIFSRSRRVGILTSPQMQTLAQTELSQELKLLFEVLPTSVHTTEDGVSIDYYVNQSLQQLHVDYLLVATGRQSWLDSLKLENISSDLTDLKTLPIDPQSKQLADYPIFVVGDAHTSTPIQHEAAHEGRAAVYNCLHPQVKNLKTLTPLAIVFSCPQMAIVGKSYKDLTQQHIDFVIGRVDYSRQGRALVLAQNQGAVEIYVEAKTQHLLGAELFCPAAEHLAHLLAWIIDAKMSLTEVLSKPFYHPTLEEGLRTAFKHARRELNARKKI